MNYTCSAIDSGLFIYTNGDVKTCCAGHPSFGNIKEKTLDEIFKSKKYIEIQSTISANKPHAYCQTCYNIDAIAPNRSQMYAFNNMYPSIGKRETKQIDIRWSNTCNLSCRYCTAHDSSEWAKLHKIKLETVDRDYFQSVFEEIKRSKDTINSVYLLGGEPLLQKQNIELLDIVNPNVTIDILTNLSTKLENNLVYKKLIKFENVSWHLSFDNIGEQFEYVRHGASWKTFTENLYKLFNDVGHRKVNFHPVYSIWSCLHLEEFYNLAAQHGINVNWQLAQPKAEVSELDTDSFQVFGQKSKLIERAIEVIDRLDTKNEGLIGIKKNLLKDIEVPGKTQEFLDWTDKMEKFMPPIKSFKDLWPETYRLLTN